MKTEKFLIRLITFPIKLIVQLIIGIHNAFLYSFNWLKYGSSEIVYRKGAESALHELIKANVELVKQLKNEK